MRELKFRFFDHKLTNEMIYQQSYEAKNVIFNKWEATPKCSSLMQYTGVLDVNGREIYEGDILKHTMSVRTGTRRVKSGRSYESYAKNEDKEIIGVVKQGEYSVGIRNKKIPCLIVESNISTSYDSYFWGEGKRTDRPDKITQNLSEPLYSDKKYEIIGNIYENPELLENN
jgi:uncharacterized phage protein (TIGR01671 family)